jgi:DHA1 family inner membrane transport protein
MSGASHESSPAHSAQVMGKSAVGAAIALYTAGGLFWAFLPFFIGLQADRGGLGVAQAGALGSAYLTGFTLAGIAAPWWTTRTPPRTAVAACVLLVWLCLGMLARSVGYFSAVAACLGVGIALGAFWAIAYRIFGAARGAERVFALAIAIGYTSLAAVTFLIGRYVVPAGGLAGMAIAIAMLISLLATGAVSLPKQLAGADVMVSNDVARGQKPKIWLALAGIFLFSLAFAAVWAFAERIGTRAGFAAPTVASVLASNLLVTGLGSLLVAALGSRVGRMSALACSYALLAVCMGMLGSAGSVVYFAVVVTGLGFGVGTGMPYQMSLVGRLDPQGRFVTLIAAMQGFGTALGPLAGGFAFAGGGATALGLVGVAALAVSFILIGAASR